ncbi:transcriptional regulator (plasmid) [Streptomyces nigrescens]|uniref:Transcriptional regulator n=1 Tax=Streptomyces nigrescens TaxID=1920 RepID=A0ABM8A825_STRNI|nr:helix-turn-helix domain-containing protein [Streptomyces nigrescens]BDM74867.1 transcriptional regulator [Streptomyces nigrescens]BDM74895.1 transcriptional regulator [Streptomyces nigrescens]
MSELFDAVDALVASRSPLPPPAERKRLRQAHALTLDEVAAALDVRRATVSGWESGKSEPRPPEREAYARLLGQLAQLYPVPEGTGAPQEDAPAAKTFSGPAPTAQTEPKGGVPKAAARATPEASSSASSATVGAQAAAPRPARAARPSQTSRRPGAPKAAPARTPAPGGAYAHGPLLVLDADAQRNVTGYGIGGLILDVPAKSLTALVEWTLAEAQLGAERLHGSGKDADPLLVLTEAACERYGLPAALSEAERLAGRLAEGHKVIKQLQRADWQLTKRGLGPWARIYRPAQGGRRQCVQLCIPSWRALDTRAWGHAAQLEPAELARVLGVYAQRVMTPVGSAAVTGLQLMTALNPPTRASQPDADSRRHSEHRPGSLGTQPVDPAPCEATDGHPVLADLPRFHVRGPDEKLLEEAYDWARDLTDAECMQRYLVGIDVNLAFGAAANGAVVGLASPPVHVTRPVFDAAVPGSWLVDLSHVDLSRVKVAKQWRDLDAALLPSPFTPNGERPTGPAWYATPTVAYAVELGYDVAPVEAWLRRESGRFLDGWYKRLRDAYVATMADLGVAEKLSPAEFLEAMDGYKSRDPELGIVVDAVKMTVKGGIGKLQEKARGGGWKPGHAWPALARPTWRPDIRAAVISRARVNMHRKMLCLAAATGRYPVAVLSDCAVYAADGPSPLDVLPYDAGGKTVPGSFRLGVSPGMVKHEGTQSVLWGAEVLEQLADDNRVANLARYIKTGEISSKDTGE